MITSKELQYVDSWANKTPMPGIEYSKKILEEMKKCYETYNEKYKDKEYNIIFSNSEEIKFEILNKNLCHLLGIDYTNIRGEYFNKYRQEVFGISPEISLTSYNLLELILENSDKVIEYDNDQNVKEKVINYYKSGIKCAIFNKLSDFDEFNFATINYKNMDNKDNLDNMDNTNNTDNTDNTKCENQKFFFIPSNEAVCPYFIMGIKPDSNNENSYIVNTLLAPQNPVKFFKDQEIIIPTQILISDNNTLKKINATPEEKIKLLTMCKNIINLYNIPNKINIYGDYESLLNDLENSYVKVKK